MKHSSIFGAALCCALFFSPNPVSAEFLWNLPAEVSDKNAEVTFEVDTTFHVVHGKTSGIHGKVWLENTSDPTSIRGEMGVPVKSFFTDNSSRDETLRESMAEPKFPEVALKVERSEGLCTPAELQTKESCEGFLVGTLQIHGVSQVFKFPISVKRVGADYQVSGEFIFPWTSFGVEDPSIFIARVNKNVKIKYKMELVAHG